MAAGSHLANLDLTITLEQFNTKCIVIHHFQLIWGLWTHFLYHFYISLKTIQDGCWQPYWIPLWPYLLISVLLFAWFKHIPYWLKFITNHSEYQEEVSSFVTVRHSCGPGFKIVHIIWSVAYFILHDYFKIDDLIKSPRYQLSSGHFWWKNIHLATDN